MTSRAALGLAALALAAASPAGVFAQASPAAKKEKAEQKDAFAKTYGMEGLTAPDNLAGGALGLGADDISKITSARSLASSLLTGIGADGKLKAGVGFSFTPFDVGYRANYFNYQDHYGTRLLARTSVSIALAQGETEDSDGAVALGVQTVLYDRGDLLLREWDGADQTKPRQSRVAAGECYRRALVQAESGDLPEPDSIEGGNVATSLSKEALQAITACRTALRAATWNDASLAVGLVSVSRAQGNSITALSQSNTVAYLSLSYGFEWFGDNDDDFRVARDGDEAFGGLASGCGKTFKLTCNAQIVINAKYQSDAAFEVKGVGPSSGESFSYGAKLVLGNERSVGYAFYRQEDVDFSFGERDIHEYGLGVETRINDGAWFNISTSRRDDDIGGPESVVKAKTTWKFTGAPALANPFAPRPAQ